MTTLDALRGELEPPFADDEVRVVQLPVPGAPADPDAGGVERLLEVEPEEPAVFWEADGRVAAGSGGAVILRGAGPDRMREIDQAAAQLWQRVRVVATGGIQATAPRLFGGFAFLPGPQPHVWQPFGDARFILPRVMYSADRAGARLSVVVTADEARRQGSDPAVRRVRSVLAMLGSAREEPSGPAPDEDGLADRAGTEGGAEGWGRAVASIQGMIRAGRADKIVAARVRELRFRSPPRPASVLRRLGPSSTGARWAIRLGDATFLGATPERLVSRRGIEVRSEALAGSAGTDDPGNAGALLASLKDGVEHRLVVRAIADVLAPLCQRLDYPPRPAIQRLPHVLHLRTPFDGTLSRPVPVLDLVARLHPTPAVGGTPAAVALEWIARQEGVGRGWYAAPVGWLDADGDGDFMVALRSALVAGDRALLYAGAGIVRDSDAAAELAETEAKLRTMMDAFGVAS